MNKIIISLLIIGIVFLAGCDNEVESENTIHFESRAEAQLDLYEHSEANQPNIRECFNYCKSQRFRGFLGDNDRWTDNSCLDVCKPK